MIDRALLRYLLAVVDKGNFSRAAAHCGVSQPTLSVGIARLEAELGKAVFVRSNRRVELTGAGARLLDRARRIEREFTLAEQESEATAAPKRLRLGILATLPSGWIEAAMQAAGRGAPHERIEIISGAERPLTAQLDRGRLDVLLSLVRPGRSRFSETLFEEPYRLVLPVNHPLVSRAAIEPEQVGDAAMIVRRHCEVLPDVSRFFTSRSVRPFISARTESDDLAISLVRAGHGLTVMPAGFAADGIAMVRLAGFDQVRTIGLLHDRPPVERVPSPALDIVAQTIRDQAAGI